MTENHDYDTPAEGTVDWHVPLNRNFERIDTDVEIRDTEADRSTYQPKQGAKYFAVDTGEVYVGDGSAWRAIGSIKELAGNVYVQSSEPANPEENDIWIDTS
jgi:hypothetical protein